MTLCFGEEQPPLPWLVGCGIPGQQGTGAGRQEAATAVRPSRSWQGGCALPRKDGRWDGAC